ncbi:MAG: CoA transferase [Deltaproteobacteria bacterium]|nr:CoA transferase [Deltaproteobacteria bacterium]MBW2136305.1 CoA transferase [Deltaproteobacteria bacterium]
MDEEYSHCALPLASLRILDLAHGRTGFCTRLLADLGAEVIMVERPGGDPARECGPFFEDSRGKRGSLSFFYGNTNKLSITLNLQNPKAGSIFRGLVKQADVCVEAFAPGYLDRLALGYQDLRRLNPRLILASISGHGQDGPRKGYKTCDLAASAFGGQMYATGSPSKSPLKAFGEQSYFSASLFAALGILMALKVRDKSGKGDHLDISMQEAVAGTLEHVLPSYQGNDSVPGRRGPRHWNNSFAILPCKDGFIQLTPLLQWDTLVEWLDSEGMAEDLKDERWRDPSYRLSHADHIVEVLSRWTSAHSVTDLFEKGQLMRFPWAPVQTPSEIIRCPQLRARGFFVAAGRTGKERHLEAPRFPFKFNPPLPLTHLPLPEPGEHNMRIYGQMLGLTGEEIEELKEGRII